MSDITRILSALDGGDANAAEELLPLVYDELRKLAAARMTHEAPDHTLQATALVHEAYLRLIGSQPTPWSGRGHFFAAAAEAMRRILLNRARDRHRQKRGGDRRRVNLDSVELAVDAPPEELEELDECLTRLAEENAECAQVVKLRFFAGLTLSETAAALGVSPSTAKRHWAYARAWLYDAMRPDGDAVSR
jgi:RNA polymerase sigma factor (TIGR02999 family)